MVDPQRVRRRPGNPASAGFFIVAIFVNGFATRTFRQVPEGEWATAGTNLAKMALTEAIHGFFDAFITDSSFNAMTPHSPSPRELIRLRTGQDGRRLLFQARHYQLCHEGSEQRIELGYAGSRVLERLLQDPGDVVSREELLEYGWTDRVVSQGSLNQQIYVLRQILGDQKGRIIQTLPRRGYLFNPEFIDAILSEHPVRAATGGKPTLGRRLPGWLKLGGLVALTPLLATCAAQLSHL